MARVGAVIALLLALLPVAGLVLAWGAPTPSFLGASPRPDVAELIRLGARTVGLAALVVPIALALGTSLAWAEHRARYPGRRILALLCLLPLAVPSYILAATLREQLAPTGFVGGLLGVTGPFTGFGPAGLALVLCATPYVQLLVGAALRRVPAAEEEAARSLGASRARVFFAVVTPRLRPTWAFATVISALYVISDFGAVAVLDCEVLTWRLYQAADLLHLERAIAYGFGLMALSVPVIALARWLHGQQRVERALSAPRQCRRRTLSGIALAPVLIGQALVAGLGLVLPTVTLAAWWTRGLRAGLTFTPVFGPVGWTLTLGALGTIACVGFALSPSWLAGRTRGAFGRLTEHAVYVASGLPGVLVGFGLLELRVVLDRLGVRLGSRTLGVALERAFVLIVCAYALRFMTLAYGALKPAVLRLDPRLEEAGRALGANPLRVFVRITIPRMLPGIGAAFALVFLSIVKELPITLLLAPTGVRTLAYRVWSAYQDAALADAGAAGLLVLGSAVVAQVLLLRWRGR